jgi:hypothetical protein
MISGRMRNDASSAFVFGKLGHGVKGTSELECTHSLEVLAFQVNLRASPLVKGTRSHYRRDMGMTEKALLCGQDAVKHIVCNL